MRKFLVKRSVTVVGMSCSGAVLLACLLVPTSVQGQWGPPAVRVPPAAPPPPQAPPPPPSTYGPPGPPSHHTPHHVQMAAPRPSAWQSEGWVLLGEETVKGRVDRDTVMVGRHEGRFTSLMLAVEDGDIDLHHVVVTFTNGEQFAPPMNFRFYRGQTSHVIDLPGYARGIQRVDFQYGKASRRSRPRVQLWARSAPVPPPPPPPVAVVQPVVHPAPPPPVWSPQGWVLLGERSVRGRVDRDMIPVGRRQRFSQLTLVVDGSDLNLHHLVVVFADGERYAPPVGGFYRPGTRTHLIPLPGPHRPIRRVELQYSNLPTPGRARVQLWAR